IHGYWASLAGLLPVVGAEAAVALCGAGERVVPDVRRRFADDVWLREGGMLMVSAAPGQDAAVERAVAAAAGVARSEEAVPLSREELAARVRSPAFRRGVFFRDGATVHPGRLVRALRRAAIDAGAVVHEGTPALRVRDGEVLVPDGVLRAREIVLATN